METLLPGISAEQVPTGRLTVAMLSVPEQAGPPVLFVHGNVSSSLFWQPTMLALPEPYRPLAIDLRGFGGTPGLDGTLCDPSGAGSGGGTANQDFIARLAAGDRGDASVLSPRQVLLAHCVKPPHVPEHLDIFVASMLSTQLGDDHYPGTARTVEAWPPQPMIAQTRAVLDGTPAPAAATARSSSRTPATARTWTSPNSSWPP